MAIGLIGRKVAMTQIFDENGRAVPVTVVEAGPCHVLQLRTQDRDGYEAIQLGFLEKPRRRASRAERGHVANIDSKRSRKLTAAGAEPKAKAGCEPRRVIREFRVPVEGYSVGQELKVDVFGGVAAVDVIGTTKGRGYQGVMKRHGFSGQRATHGVKKCHRHPGSTGMNTFPARVLKGKRMAGQYGNERCTIRNLRLVRVDADNNLLLIGGAVPGPSGAFVVIRPTNKAKRGQPAK